MSYITNELYGGFSGLQQQQGLVQQYQNALSSCTTTAASSTGICWVGYQDAIKAVANDRMEVGVDPRAWLRQRIKEIEWRA